MPARDGVRLATDIYFPSSGGLAARGPFPALVERTPYDKDAARFVLTARYFAQHGYVVLMSKTSAAAAIPKASGIRSRMRRLTATTR